MIFITDRRVAELAGVALSTVYRWIREDQLPHYRRGHWFRIDKADLTYTLK